MAHFLLEIGSRFRLPQKSAACADSSQPLWACGQWSACADQTRISGARLRRTSAAHVGGARRRRPTPGATRPKRPISIDAIKSASLGLRPMVGLRRPDPHQRRTSAAHVGAGRRPAQRAQKGRFQSTPSSQPLWACGQWSACADQTRISGARLRRTSAARVGAGRRPAQRAQKGRFQSTPSGA